MQQMSLLHTLGVVHGDMKPDNVVFIKPIGVNPIGVRLIDFEGSSSSICSDPVLPQKFTNGFVGWSRVESVNIQGYLGAGTYADDVWAFAVTLYVFLFNTDSPFVIEMKDGRLPRFMAPPRWVPPHGVDPRTFYGNLVDTQCFTDEEEARRRLNTSPHPSVVSKRKPAWSQH